MTVINPKICIIGCGTYGTYLAKRLVETLGKNAQITVIEIGNEKIKDEKEMGIEAESTAASAAQNGRYFGLGGTSARWGGQVLFFDKRDNPANDSHWNTIIDINERYKHAVIKNLLGNTKAMDKLGNDKADLKTGIWLKYSRRNIYKLLDKNTLASVRILKNKRVTDFIFENKTIRAVKCTNIEGVSEIIEADIFYLTAGAIESCRLMLDINERHNVLINNDLGKHYGDHLSVELFRITNQLPNIEGKDLLPRFMNGSLITKRLIEVANNGQVGFAHPVINKEVQVFTAIKKILFGKQENRFKIKEVLVGIEFLLRFGFNALILKKMYVHRKTWSLQLEMEQAFPNANFISLSDKIDNYGQKAARLNWSVSQEDKNAIEDIKTSLSQWLRKNGVEFSVVYDPNIASTKIEDVYHPAGFMRMGQDEKAVLDYDCRVKGIDNLFHFSTAMFPSAKSINPTGAGFCFVEHHVDTFFNKNDMVSGIHSPKPSKTLVTVRLFFRRANPTGNVSIENSFGSMIVHFPKKSPFQLDIFCTSFYSRGLLPRLRAILEVRRHKAEINHVTGDTNFLVLGLPRKNTILTIHDCGLLDGKNPISRWILWAFWLKLPVKHCRFLTVVSEATKADVIRYTNCPAEKIRVIPTVIKSEFKQSPKTFSKKYPTFLHIGNSPNKNLERHAAALKGIPCCFHIIGQISEEQISLLKEYKIDYKISVNLSEEDMLKAYENADILLFCSLIEGFGMPIVEAQTVGRVVITSNISSMPEVAGRGACFVNPLSIEDIRAGIESVLNNDSYRISLIEKGFENTQRFDPKNIAKQYNQLYRELFES